MWAADFPFSPAGRRWPEGSDEGEAKRTVFAVEHPLIPLPGPSPRGEKGASCTRPYGTDFTSAVGGFRLPQKAGSSTLSLLIAAPGILMFGPQASIVTVPLRPRTS